MNIDASVAIATDMIHAIFRHGVPVDQDSLSYLFNSEDPERFNDHTLTNMYPQAFRLLLASPYVMSRSAGRNFELTDLAKDAVRSGLSVRFNGQWFNNWLENEFLLESASLERTTNTTIITELSVREWRQFSNVDIVFHPRLTILTGANGAGKTTLLNILTPHFNFSAQLLTRRSGESVDSPEVEVGRISYSNGGMSSLIQYAGVGIHDAPILIANQNAVTGIFISSHRSISSYQPLQALPARFSEWDTLMQEFTSEIQMRYSGGHSGSSPLYRMKEALVSAAMYAYGNEAVRPNASAKELWEGYQVVLRRFLPPSMKFQGFIVEDSEIIIVTDSSEFPLEAVSGGISAMLELSWQIYLRQKGQSSFTVCIDEPENHLHPELQRSIVPSLMAGFPDVTFIVATHSPFVVTSTQDAYVYTLGPDEEGKVSSRRVEGLNYSATPDETLMNVLGLDTTLPIWAETKLDQLLHAMSTSPTTNDLRQLRDELTKLGLDRQFPAAIRSLDI